MDFINSFLYTYNNVQSSTGSVTTPRRTTRAAVKALPVLLEVEANEDEGKLK